MTEEEKDAAAGEPLESSESDAAPIALPETTPPPPAQSHTPPMGTPPPQQPHTPPMGVPEGYAPQGSYAMGALAGNPMLGAQGSPHAGPSAGPGGFGWSAPSASTSTGGGTHRMRTAALVGGAALAALGLGVGLGHLTWSTGPSRFSALPSSGSGQLPFRTSPTSPSGNGFPFDPGNSGNSGSSGSSGNSGSSNSGPSDVNSIAAKVDPGLVDINTTLGYSQEQAAGTGIVLTSDGVVLTNNHVINGATSISVTDVGNHKTYSATVVGYDRTQDIAVLALHNASGLQTATIGNSSSLSVGQDVVGVGNAGGTGGTPSAAGGTVTALNQSITASDEGDGTSEQLTGLIQTNANIQPGDSGGALVNDSGEVMGVDTAASAGFSFQYNQSQGNEGFAIPINTALTIAHQIEGGQASSTVHIGATAFLGVEISPQGGNAGNSSGGPFGGFFGNSGSGNSGSNVSGASVAGTVTNGPAQEAGLAQGDVITSLGGKTIGTADDLTNAMATHHPGDKVSVGWTDTNGNPHTATVQLSSGPPQ